MGKDFGRRMVVPAIAGLALWPAAVAPAQPTGTAFSPACDDEAHAGFDFWLGDWQVFDARSGELAGFDRIARTLDGCAIRQQWFQFNDEFRPDGAASRLRGESLIAPMHDGRWRQSWVDTSGFSLTLAGRRDPESGDIVLHSEPVPYPRGDGSFVDVYFRWHWAAREDGTVRSWGYRRIGEEGDWEAGFDNIYRPNR